MPSCAFCKTQFEITDLDRKFYQKIDVPEPKLCPDCRQQRRVAWRNERTLYLRTCALCKKDTVSIYSPDPLVGRDKNPTVVYCQDCWWSDKWNPLSFGMDFDPSRPFFDQLLVLQSKVPRVAITNTNSVNSEYTNYTANNKNCYLVFSNSYGHNEDCYYGTSLAKNRSCIDATQLEDCERCYDCVDCKGCYGLVRSQMCLNCRDSRFLEDCRNCTDCLMCKGLRNKQYCILNKQYTKEEYGQKLASMRLSCRSGFDDADKQFSAFRLTVPSLFSYQINSQDCTGDYITNSSDCRACFDTTDTENAAFLQYSVNHNKDLYDGSYSGGCEIGYNNLSYVGGYNCMGCNLIWWDVANLRYSELCFNNARDCFGAIGLRGKQYCILNKQFTKDVYEKITATIIDSLKQSGEWGEFLPARLSPFGYNETMAQDYYPMKRDEAVAGGWLWNDRVPGRFDRGDIDMKQIADCVKNISEDIVKKTLTCEQCKKNFKILKQELMFYQTVKIPVPRQCFDCRYLERQHRRRPRHLWERQCLCDLVGHAFHTGRCATMFPTSFAPDRKDLVYCEPCYQAEIA